jgi:hypothetical protein
MNVLLRPSGLKLIRHRDMDVVKHKKKKELGGLSIDHHPKLEACHRREHLKAHRRGGLFFPTMTA